MLFCNEDRRLNNIAVLHWGEEFAYCPIFDFGADLLSNTLDYMERPSILTSEATTSAKQRTTLPATSAPIVKRKPEKAISGRPRHRYR